MRFGKSFRTKKEKELIKVEKEKLNVEINFQKSDRARKYKSRNRGK